MDNKGTNLNNLVNILAVIGSFSFALYFIGLIRQSSYYGTIGVPFDTSQYQYSEFAVLGALTFLPFLVIYAPYIFIRIIHFRRINSDISFNEDSVNELVKGEGELDSMISESKNEDSIVRMKEVSKKGKDLRKKFDEQMVNLKLEKEKLFREWGGREDKLFFFFLFLFNVLIIVVLYFQFDIISTSFMTGLFTISIGYVTYITTKHILEKRYHRLAMNSGLLLVTALLIPFLNGSVQGYMDLANNNFTKVIVTGIDSQYEAQYFFEKEDNYILRIEGKVVSIPKENIEKIEWIKGRKIYEYLYK